MSEHEKETHREPEKTQPSPPAANVTSHRRVSLAWIIPLLAIVVAAWLGYEAWIDRGTIIAIRFSDGQSIKPGDALRYRGIEVGEVRAVSLDDDYGEVLVTASLFDAPNTIARTGSRFWVVRPQIGLRGVGGLETLIGARYLAVLPGRGEPRRTFDGLDQPPVVETIKPDDLEIILEAPTRGSLRRGAPVLYRRHKVGTVLSVGLASDSATIEARAHIESIYASLIREQTKFWDTGGVNFDLKVTGVTVKVDSVESLLAGGVSLATPPLEQAGDRVSTGRRFAIALEPDDDWLEWAPVIAIGNSFLPSGATAPNPLRATLSWTHDGWLRRDKFRHGWVLQTTAGLLGPANLFNPSSNAEEGSAVLEVAGQQSPLDELMRWQGSGLALLDITVPGDPWPTKRLRHPDEPEDCIVLADSAGQPMALARGRLRQRQNHWRIDSAVPFDRTWHGAAVISRADGKVVGLLSVDDDDQAVVLKVPANAEWGRTKAKQ